MYEEELARGSNEKDKVICCGCGNRDATTFHWLASNLWCEKCGEFGVEPFMTEWDKYNKQYS